jgi:hypothetical protein
MLGMGDGYVEQQSFRPLATAVRSRDEKLLSLHSKKYKAARAPSPHQK